MAVAACNLWKKFFNVTIMLDEEMDTDAGSSVMNDESAPSTTATSDISLGAPPSVSATKKPSMSAKVKEHFSRMDDGQHKCKHCRRVFKFTTSASNLKYHLEHSHAIVWRKLQESEPKKIHKDFQSSKSSDPGNNGKKLSKLEQARGEKLLVALAAETNVSYRFFESDAFIACVKFLNRCDGNFEVRKILMS